MLRGFASAAVSDWELRRAVAEHEANERRLQFDASHDALTGLANRAVLLSRLRAALERPSPPADRVGAAVGRRGRRRRPKSWWPCSSSTSTISAR